LESTSQALAIMLTLSIMVGFPLIVVLHANKLRGGRSFTLLLSAILLAFLANVAWVAALAAGGLP
jgi:hypothetical protein